jgi:hypothetical protein
MFKCIIFCWAAEQHGLLMFYTRVLGLARALLQHFAAQTLLAARLYL